MGQVLATIQWTDSPLDKRFYAQWFDIFVVLKMVTDKNQIPRNVNIFYKSNRDHWTSS